MHVIIMGCSRTGAQLAAMLDSEGLQVTILDLQQGAFRLLPNTFQGTAMVGDGTDADVLRRAGIEEAEAFIAVTQDENRNIMAAQIAQHLFRVPRVFCRIHDPEREELYRSLGMHTINPPRLAAQQLRDLVLGSEAFA